MMHQLKERSPWLSLFQNLLMFEKYQNPNVHLSPHNSSLALNAATLSADLNVVVNSSLKLHIEFFELVEYVTQISKFCNPFCVTQMCCQW